MPEEVKPAQPTTPEPAPAPAVEPPKPAEPATPGPVIAPKEGDTPPPAARVVPEKYDLQNPKDSLLGETELKAVEKYAKENKLTQEEAQAMVTEQAQYSKEHVERQKQSWLEASKSDPEIGGDKLSESLSLSKKVLDKFDPKGVFKVELEKYGYGNHPEMIRLLSAIGRAMEDDKVVHGGPTVAQKSSAEVLYGGSRQQA